MHTTPGNGAAVQPAPHTNTRALRSLAALADALDLEMGELVRRETGFTPIHLAVMFGNIESVEALIAVGANVRVRSEPHQWTPITLASMREDSKNIYNLLNREIKHGKCATCRTSCALM